MRSILVAAILLASPACAQAPAVDQSLAALSESLSEPGGYFDTDNLISNEASYLHVMDGLRERGVRGGAYVGVGPDQNFSYIAQIRPEIAVIVDIRRDNLLEQLLFKALFELAESRGEYLALLLSRPAPTDLGPDAPVERLTTYFDSVAFDPRMLLATRERLHRRIEGFGFDLDEADLATIDRYHQAFGEAGLGLRFQSFGRPPQYYYPTLRDLILERDRSGRQASYLAHEEAFETVRRLQLADRVVPVVGDLAGDHAIPSVARFLRERGEPLSAFYTSNVEFYLANDGTLDDFLENLSEFSLAPNAVVIRSLFRTPHPQSVPGYASTQLLQPIDTLLATYRRGEVRSYWDVITNYE